MWGQGRTGGMDGVCVHSGVCLMHVCGDQRSTSSIAPQELSALFLETGSPTGAHNSLIRLGWQVLYPLNHLPNSKSLSLILSDAREVKEGATDQFPPLGF